MVCRRHERSQQTGGVGRCRYGHDVPRLSRNHLVELVEEGTVPEAIVDEAVRRILRLKFMLGLFEEPYSVEAEWDSSILKPEYLETALQLATQSMVLLKNEGDLLPLSPNLKKIALIGPLADRSS